MFLCIAAGLHLAALAMTPDDPAVSAQGEDGEAVISLAASNESVAEMVETWDRPPETLSKVAPAAAPPPPPRMEPPRAIAAPAPPRPDAPGLAVPRAERLPDIETSAPPPPPEPKPEPEPEPEIAPEPQPEPPTQSAAAVERSLRPTLRPDRPEPAPERARRPETSQTPPRRTQASPAQRAAGQGQGAAAGSVRRADTATLSDRERQSLSARWGGHVRAAVERRKRYPGDARGASGTAVVRITVGRDGSLRAVALARSSGSGALDQAALRAVQAARSFPPAPAGLTDPTYTFTLPMSFNS